MTDGGANVQPTATIGDQVKELKTHCITEYQHNEEQLPCWCLEQIQQYYLYYGRMYPVACVTTNK
jgi:hypothetical protein